MIQEDAIKRENEKILAYIAEGKSRKVLERARKNAEAAAATGIDALEGNCAFTLGRAAHESGQHLEAIKAYNNALGKAILFRNTKATASIHFSMATALLERPDGDRRENLEMAITNHSAALNMIDKISQPIDYAMIQYNMGFAYAELTTKFGQSFQNQAKNCFEEAARAFRNLGMTANVRKAEDALQSISGFSR
jgi:tetratricopeptide (TPR) repeat protein